MKLSQSPISIQLVRDKIIMGFSTVYLDSFQFDRPLDLQHAEILREFNDIEHEDEAGNPGGDGKPPTLYCQWVPTQDFCGLEWDKVEKFNYGREWLVYLIERFIDPWGYKLNGENHWFIDDFQSAGAIKVVDNVVTEEPRDILELKARYGIQDNDDRDRNFNMAMLNDLTRELF